MAGESYRDFAAVYDLFMDNIDYDAWSRDLIGDLRSFGIADGLVCELGCGTGNITMRLAEAGYDMIGIDRSAEMLAEAETKKQKSIAGRQDKPDGRVRDILYLCQDMRAFELYGTVRAIVSVCDSMSYMLSKKDLLQVMKLVRNYLDPGGVFLFDLNTEYYFQRIGSRTIAENRSEAGFIWENYYDQAARINTYLLTLFLPAAAEKGRLKPPEIFRRVQEEHRERAWRLDEVKELLMAAGMEFLSAREAFTRNAVSEKSDRICIMARKPTGGRRPVQNNNEKKQK